MFEEVVVVLPLWLKASRAKTLGLNRLLTSLSEWKDDSEDEEVRNEAEDEGEDDSGDGGEECFGEVDAGEPVLEFDVAEEDDMEQDRGQEGQEGGWDEEEIGIGSSFTRASRKSDRAG